MNLSLLLFVFLAAIAFRIVMHFVDKNRIKDEVETKLGRVVSIAWNPFGRGWFFEMGERHYDVTYIDRSGATISTACKTSFFTGVYWAEGPRLAEAPPRLMSRHLCANCATLSTSNGALVPTVAKPPSSHKLTSQVRFS